MPQKSEYSLIFIYLVCTVSINVVAPAVCCFIRQRLQGSRRKRGRMEAKTGTQTIPSDSCWVVLLPIIVEEWDQTGGKMDEENHFMRTSLFLLNDLHSFNASAHRNSLCGFISRCREVVFPSVFQMSDAGTLDWGFHGLNCPGFAGVAIRACVQAGEMNASQCFNANSHHLCCTSRKPCAVASAGYKVRFFVAMELRAPPDGML